MLGWFGRKSAPERQAFVPAWLQGEGEQGGFARGVDGMQVLDLSSGLLVLRLAGSWESGIIRADEYRVGGMAVLRARQPAIADPAGGTVIDGQCRAAIGSILAMLRTHGLIAS